MFRFKVIVTLLSAVFLISCAQYPPLDKDAKVDSNYTYIIGPGDGIEIFVWDNPDISKSVTVRPDGKISTPLIDDLVASGKTPSQLARAIEENLSKYVRDPLVSIIVNGFVGIYEQQVRVIGQLSGSGGGGGGGGGGGVGSSRYTAKAFPYKKEMTLLDLMIQLGGIGRYADGNRASIIRKIDGKTVQFGVKIDDLVDDADLSANVRILPGDILIVPQAFF